MTGLRLKAGVFEKLVWSRPDSRITPFCSMCQAHISGDAVQMLMWSSEGACVQFCDACSETCFEPDQ